MTIIPIRPRTENDLSSASELLVKVHALDGYPVEGVADPQAWLVSDSLIQSWVADNGERIVGHVSISQATSGDDAARMWFDRTGQAPETIAVLGRLFVDPDTRGASLGKRLVQTAMTEADSRGLRLTLDVMTKDRAAISLYERLGWTLIGEAAHTFGAGQSAPAVCYVAPEAANTP
ncbi:GNAT family N-acetyltransferase [Actinokineospora sp. PR83]|uniref:GNAT family N-acetyltransferase n=1 Tax=Actinokineospora sp. PR83 TaxID=2884908 RepID=UPI001F3F4A5E|nr:GNAT family N-acetyltransferase [Actinokineospora sp. PR83]MCG8915392.1 GNAT family N-acetyltransferase [Actinokineospora sp. PR83]